MPQNDLYKTTRYGLGRAAHHHIVYINEDTQQGICSTANNHAHIVYFQPPTPAQPPQFDPYGIMIAPGQPANPGGWIIQPAADGHTHQITVYERSIKQEKESPEDTVRDVLAQYKYCIELEKESVTEAKEAEKFYIGEQWHDVDKQQLEAKNRAALTINRIQPKIDELTGFQKQQRTDIRYLPTEEGDQRVADMLNIIVKRILSKCHFEREESRVFEDMAICGRGFFNIIVNFEKDIRGQILVERYPWTDAKLGPHTKEDLSDLEFLLKDKMYSRAKAKQLWKDKAEEIEAAFELSFMGEPQTHKTVQEDQYAYSENKLPAAIDADTVLIDNLKKEIRVIERWQKVYTTAKVAAYAPDNYVLNLKGWNDKDIKQIETMPGFNIVEQQTYDMRITKVAGNVLLSDEHPADLPLNDFFLIPAYGKKRADKFYGKVKSAIDPQKQKNKHASQAIDIGNKMCAYGWFFDDMTFANKTEENLFRDTSTSPGFQVKVQSTDHPPVKVEGTKFPGELVQLMMVDDQTIDEQLATVPVPTGANQSGAHFTAQQKAKLIGSEWLFDNLSFAKKLLGERLIPVIQRYYTPEMMFRILNNQHRKAPLQLGGVDFNQFSQEEIINLLTESDLSLYDVEVQESDWSPSVRIGTFALLSELAKAGMPIPPQTLISLMDIPEAERQKMLQQIQQQMMAEQEADKAKADAEIQKTMIAHGMMPQGMQPPAMPQGNAPMPTPGTPQGGIAEGAPAKATAQPPAVINFQPAIYNGQPPKKGRKLFMLKTDPATGDRYGEVVEMEDEQPQQNQQEVINGIV